MCGIAGIFHFDKERAVDNSVLRQMTDSIRHRGPDGEGFYCRGNIGLGHRRLSIIDLETGDQPMSSEDGNLVIIFNGEIYNYIELRRELESKGHRFRTSSDTEVILKAYIHWGIECLSHFNGMWAFALWDAREDQLFLSRDRMGEKPLYYACADGSVIFGSEIKALLACGKHFSPATELLDIYLSLSYIPAPYTFFRGISQLEPAHYAIVKNGGITVKRYWDLEQVPENEMRTDRNEVCKEFEYLLDDSVKIRMRSDVPFGAFLSGGLDSSAIVTLMSRKSQFPVETFTIGFDDRNFDERHLAREVAEKFRTSHHEYVVEPSAFDESLARVLDHFDDPFGDSSALPTSYVSAFAARRVKMVLTGDGGDEVLSGYTGYQGEKFAERYQRIPAIIRKSVPALAGGIAAPFKGSLRYRLNRVKKVTSLSDKPFEQRLYAKIAWLEPALLKNLVTGTKEIIPFRDYLSDFMAGCTYKDSFYKLMYFHLKNSLPGDMLTKVDRMSMAHSIETRVPFLDHRLVEMMVRVHKDIKMEGSERKSVLRRTVARDLPPSLLSAGKKGFGVPLREWFKDKSFEHRLDQLHFNDLPLNGEVVKKIISDNRAGSKDYGNFIWMLFVLNKWMKNFG